MNDQDLADRVILAMCVAVLVGIAVVAIAS
jgi:hypothetical protein